MRKTIRIITYLFLIVFILLVLSSNSVFARKKLNVKSVELTDEYRQWLELPEEEKENRIEPRKYEIPKYENNSKNILQYTRLYGDSLTNRFSLREYIPENIVVRDQMTTELCWDFSSLSSLETNLALKNYYNHSQVKTYNFSERHMDYSLTRTFLNGQINEFGYTRNPASVGNTYMSTSYLTNGMGAILESDMLFESNGNTIDINQIKNKEVQTRLYDTIDFPSYRVTDDLTAIKRQMKEHIVNYGSIVVAICGNLNDVNNTDDINSNEINYNNTTGAIYCNNTVVFPINHMVSVIGWDDNYSKNNFAEGHKPTKDGAWIIKNSYGETNVEYTMNELKNIFYNEEPSYWISQGYNSASDLPDELIINLVTSQGYVQRGDKFVYPLGDFGIMYLSYEDVNVYRKMWGVIKSADEIDYENIYQYNELLLENAMVFQNTSNLYLANKYSKKTQDKEYITGISISAPEHYKCKVYINPNSSSIERSQLQQVMLKSGETIEFDAGYHTIELANPMKINSNEFAVVVEIIDLVDKEIYAMVENNSDLDTYDDNVKIETDKCFISDDFNEWYDLSRFGEFGDGLKDSDSTIKVFTTSQVNDDSLNHIRITKQPNKIQYIEGQNFERDGMEVTAYFNNDTSRVITEYEVLNGTNLKLNQTSVIIKYEDQEVEQPITVERNTLESINIKTPPNKTVYYDGENFDKTGMTLELVYKNGSKETISSGFNIQNGDNLTQGQTSVTVIYEGLEINIKITVLVNDVQSISIKNEGTNKNYYEGQNFNKEGLAIEITYKNGSKETISSGFNIQNGENLRRGQTSVIIEYKGKTVEQAITVEEDSVDSIQLKNGPDKTNYFEGDNFVSSGIEIEVTYKSSRKETVNKGYTIQDGENLRKNQTYVILIYHNKELRISITVTENSIESITIKRNPNKTVYVEGENFDSQGLEIDVKYKNGSHETVTNGYEIQNGGNLALGQTNVTVIYNGIELNIPIVVLENNVESISIKVRANKTVYYEGENFDSEGLEIQVNHKNGEIETIKNGYRILNGDNLKLNQTQVIIEYASKTVEHSITVKNNTIVEVSIKTPPYKTEYIQGEDFNPDGLELEVKYENGKVEIVTTGYNILNGEKLELNQTSIEIEYASQIIEQPITVIENTIVKIEVIVPPNKTEYFESETFNPSGLVLGVTYNNGNKERVDSGYKVLNGEYLKENQKSVTVQYKGKTIEINIKVNKRIIVEPENSDFTSIKMNIKSIKNYYYTDKSKESYSIVEIEINNIKKAEENDKYEYYYCLSTNKTKVDYDNWIKIENGEIVNDKFKFNIDTRDLKNYGDVSDDSAVFLFIKEVVVKQGQQKTITTSGISFEPSDDVPFEFYIDDVKFEDIIIEPVVDKIDEVDDTVSDRELPNTGTQILFILITFLIIYGTIKIIKYRGLKEIR